MGISLNPNTFTKGGLLQDVDVEVLEAIYTTDPPPGYPAHDRVFACLAIRNVDGEEEADQYWSAGKLADFQPTPDGLDLKAVGSRGALNDNSNWSICASNLVNCGFPESKLDEAAARNTSMAVLKGLQMHVVRIPAPERLGLEKKDGARKETILVPNKILKFPWEAGKAKPGRKAARAATPAPTSAPEAPEAPATDEAAVAALEVVLDTLGKGPATLAQLKTATLRKHMKTPPAQRGQIVALAGDSEWLQSQGVTVAGDQASM